MTAVFLPVFLSLSFSAFIAGALWTVQACHMQYLLFIALFTDNYSAIHGNFRAKEIRDRRSEPYPAKPFPPLPYPPTGFPPKVFPPAGLSWRISTKWTPSELVQLSW
jgi:hypothetical protein